MRQFMKVLVVALFVSTVWTLPAHAASAWFKCEIDLAGMPNNNTALIRLTHLATTPAFTGKNFVATSENVKVIFATALTSLSSNLPVWVFADPALATPPLFFLYLTMD